MHLERHFMAFKADLGRLLSSCPVFCVSRRMVELHVLVFCVRHQPLVHILSQGKSLSIFNTFNVFNVLFYLGVLIVLNEVSAFSRVLIGIFVQSNCHFSFRLRRHQQELASVCNELGKTCPWLAKSSNF